MQQDTSAALSARVIAKSHLAFPIVGIGASAGGLEALRRLLAELPAEPGLAMVVVMHLSPEHESALGSILSRVGKLPVTTVTQTTRIAIDHVYVISPALRLVMSDGELQVYPLTTLEGRRRSVDLFFRSLAQAHAEHAVGIVLSGTGSDGAQGLRRIKEAGGLTMVQSLEDAEYDGMPRSAIQTQAVDFVMPVEEMPGKLVQLLQNARRIEMPSPPDELDVLQSRGEAAVLAEEALLSIKALLRERTGHDFSHYKRGTVLRRIERRMQVNGMPDLPSYRRLLDSEPRETPALLQDMLISVTNFFRDPDAFDLLKRSIQQFLRERQANEPFRAWVAGCASGEEAYSIAILLREVLGAHGVPVQLFASDIDERAVAAARTGVFPASIGGDVEPERLRDFFLTEAGGLRIAKSVRDTVVFSVHNVLSDPPFTRMDLICCRNLLIYLDRVAQLQVLQSFHFSLKAGGLLFLGSSETADVADTLFDEVDKTHRIYRASHQTQRARPLPPLPSRIADLPVPPPRTASASPPKPPLELLHERIVRNYSPPTVLVDADDTVLHVSHRASHLLRLPEGVPSNKLLALARPELRAELRAALSRAAETGFTVASPSVRLTINGVPSTVVMTVRPAVDETPKGLMLVVFDEARESMGLPAEGMDGRDPVIESLESELLLTQERLRNMLGESTASTEELRASNEELQTINEELRSTTEELETSREELQAVNEELTTVNSELTLRMEDSSKLSDDLQNLMNSAEIGTVFVDREMKVKRFTPQAATLFNLLPTDTGRPLLDITHRLQYDELASDVADVLRDLRRIEREVRSLDHRWFLARVVPYRTSEDRIEGAVLAFFDITSRRMIEEKLRLSEQRMRLVAESMRDYAIITMDEKGVIATWSPGAEKIFGHSLEEAVGQPFDILFEARDRAAGKPRMELQKARDTGRADDNQWHVRKNGERIFCSGITTPLGEGGVIGFAKICRNFTQEEFRERQRDAALETERATTHRLHEAGVMKDEFLAVVSHELKNPLSVIQMNAQLLSRLPTLQGESRALRAARAIQGAVASQLQIINDLLELSRANMGKLVLAPSVFDVADTLRGIVDALVSNAQAKQLTINVDAVPARLYADPVRIEQVVWNLMTNAVKFTPSGGSVHAALTVEAGMAVLTVADSGIGLHPADLAGIFEMFRQVDSGASRRSGGLGIGLALVRQLVELHGGRVAAHSEGQGRGACFTVWLPLCLAASEDVEAAQPPCSLDGLRLLVVDDEPDLLNAFGALLEGEGAQVRLCTGAEEALAQAHAGAFDAVISDIAMPGRDGYWLAQQLRADPTTRALTLVAASGMAREVDRSRALAAGFDAHLGKPVDIDLLNNVLVAAFRQRHPQATDDARRGASAGTGNKLPPATV